MTFRIAMHLLQVVNHPEKVHIIATLVSTIADYTTDTAIVRITSINGLAAKEEKLDHSCDCSFSIASCSSYINYSC